MNKISENTVKTNITRVRSSLLEDKKQNNNNSIIEIDTLDKNISVEKNTENTNTENTNNDIKNKTESKIERFQKAKEDELMPEIIDGLKKMFDDDPEYRDKKKEKIIETNNLFNNINSKRKFKGRNA